MTYSIWQQFIEINGSPAGGAAFEVRNMSDNSLASIKSDTLGTVKANPSTADGIGYAFFYVEAGLYKITASVGTSSFSFNNVAIGGAAAYDVGITGVLDKITGDSLYASIRKYNVSDTAPTVTDDISLGYTAGSQWLRPTSEELYQSFSSSVGAADWRLIDSGISLGTMAVLDQGSGASEFRNNTQNEAFFASQGSLTIVLDTILDELDTKVVSVVAGTNVTVDNTDPTNPIVSAAPSSGTFAGLTGLPTDNTLLASELADKATLNGGNVFDIGDEDFIVTDDPTFNNFSRLFGLAKRTLNPTEINAGIQLNNSVGSNSAFVNVGCDDDGSAGVNIGCENDNGSAKIFASVNIAGDSELLLEADNITIQSGSTTTLGKDAASALEAVTLQQLQAISLVASNTLAYLYANYTPASYIGREFFATDVGSSGTKMKATATMFVPINGIASIAQLALPVVRPATFTGTTNGSVTFSSAAPIAYSNCYCYAPANSITASHPAGFYWLEMITTTAGIFYNNLYTPAPGNNTFAPVSKTAFSGAVIGAAGLTSEITAFAYKLNGNLLGNYGSVSSEISFNGTLDGVKTIRHYVDTYLMHLQNVANIVRSLHSIGNFSNFGSKTTQIGSTQYQNTANNAVESLGYADTSLDVTCSFTLQASTALEWAVLSTANVNVIIN